MGPQGFGEEKGALASCLRRRLRALSEHLEWLVEPALGMWSATHVSSVLLTW